LETPGCLLVRGPATFRTPPDKFAAIQARVAVRASASDEPIERLTVTIPAPGPFRRRTSIQQGNCPARWLGTG
jgi:hypothetical protein